MTGAPSEGTLEAPHVCHANGCAAAVAPRLFMCSRHWSSVPPALKRRIWSTYRRGQEMSKRPTRLYLEAARAAIVAVDAYVRGGL